MRNRSIDRIILLVASLGLMVSIILGVVAGLALDSNNAPAHHAPLMSTSVISNDVE